MLGKLLLVDEGFPDELDRGAELPSQWLAGSPTFPCPAFASASLPAAFKDCDNSAEVGSEDIKAKITSPSIISFSPESKPSRRRTNHHLVAGVLE